MIDKREITPEFLARLSVLLFTKLHFQEILENKVSYDVVATSDIAELMMEDPYFSRAYSREECKAYAQSVTDFVSKKSAWQNGSPVSDVSGLNLFDLLLITLQDVLVVNNNRVECSYEHIFSWRILSRYLGEELSLAARYAVWDHEHGSAKRRYFDWPYVTRHNNKQLNMILARGIAEHHCHLWGSTPYFHVSWVNLMNRLTNNIYCRNLRKLNGRSWEEVGALHPRKTVFAPTGGASFPDECPPEKYGELAQLRAAWIRFYLLGRLTGVELERSMAVHYASLELITDLRNWWRLLLYKDELQSLIDTYAYIPRRRADYALNMFSWQVADASSNYEILIGERWLYYQIFLDYSKPLQNRKLSDLDYDLFLVYYLLRTRLRNEMVQSNDRIGFDNFDQIQGRKAYFLGDPGSERRLTRLAINEPLKSPRLREMEVRITPSAEQVRRLERAVNTDENGEMEAGADKRRERYYYVFHFIKQTDPLPELCDGLYPLNSEYRHSRLRWKLKQQALEILRFREEKPLLARRVLGIDAASQEIGCRPEVFSMVYRMLGEHSAEYGGYMEDADHLPPLGKTYHVGEEFLDVVDGLRAIDEVVRFLDFDCGDRLGHAVVLGTDVEEWYRNKHYTISLSIQDYLDNLAWFYHALSHFSIPHMHALQERLSADFGYWFRIVYRNNISDDLLDLIMKHARTNCYDWTHEDGGRYQAHTCHFDIMDYYRAWTLRGDDPSCYEGGYFRKPAPYGFLIPSEDCKVNKKFPTHYEDRYVAEYSILNYFYQFDKTIRREGEKKINIKISNEYVQGIKAVQIEMRYLLARKGISIETNPTSNVLISNFREYGKHPILAFYNRGLPVSEKEEMECAQLQVSINTDDSGVFYTDLETEYALLARSTEELIGEDGRPRFKRSDVCTWIDHIRRMGLDQSFQPENLTGYPASD